MTEPTLYLRCQPEDIAPLVLISGDPSRVQRTSDLLDSSRLIGVNREFAVATGQYNGVPVTVASGGIGAPSTAIALHELAQCGAKAIVRIGTMMGVEAQLGQVVLSTGAARYEGTSSSYLPLAFPAIPDWALVHALAQSGAKAKLDVQMGLTATYDAFYPQMAPDLIGEGPLDLAELRRARVLSLDMETSLVFVLARMLGVAAAVMCAVTVQAEPHAHLDADVRAEVDHRMVQAALDGLTAWGGANL